jgi:WD40 repeat protein
MALAAHGTCAALLDRDRLVIRDVDSGGDRLAIGDLTGHEDGLRLSHDGRRVSLRQRGRLKIWDTSTAALIGDWQSYGKHGDDAQMMPDGRSILGLTRPGHGLELVDIDTGAVRLHLAAKWPLWLIRVSPDGGWVAAGSARDGDGWRETEPDGDHAWDTRTGACVAHPLPGGWLRGEWVIGLSACGGSVYELATGKRVFHRPDYQQPLTAAASRSEFRDMVVGFGDGRLGLWKLAGRSEVRRLAKHRAGIVAISIGPGSLIAAAAADGAVLIGPQRDIAVGYRGPAPMRDCAFREDGQTVALDETGRLHRISG